MTARKSAPATSAPATDSSHGQPLVSMDSALFSGVSIKLDARLGSASMTVQEVLALRAGGIVTLDAQLDDLVELHLNGALVGRGEIVAVGDAFGIRLVEIATAG
ncbi:MAG TPA: FliM/FliN family flagellar motor switch protein [Brevundimonas sp.]|nr:FliM/FliN family flagellar motor switch protein [Brevundimonas sp.]